jgi:hypothetical protein
MGKYDRASSIFRMVFCTRTASGRQEAPIDWKSQSIQDRCGIASAGEQTTDAKS